ncbi:uncharacterized protein LOC133806595 [Humulus lupulus]|uniref:uncharacterized protein LOC133806595 n=1 Tax=Humulus lupulus TaxID=3486 RepID=UPI002B40BD8B|nr:uncharacterized protein LOC133806595 [Humulus lupulus]
MANLAKHGVPNDIICPIYHGEVETTYHALWGCSSLKSIRANFPIRIIEIIGCGMALYEWHEWLLDCMSSLSKEEGEKIIVLLWRIWYRRNKMVHEHVWMDDKYVVEWALKYLGRYQEAQVNVEDPSPGPFGVVKGGQSMG